ncbi:MAG: hypothetical protein NZ929_01405 [Aigarchaeota archaeon]|nr:hypothetical protein [Aigarchaeota archaeon]MCX8193053.1 hypothetical protein [Nitrososphaeria archaeon]MDW7986209.1 hypothetical protein [Nitrososphaerota archaeon]
MSKDFWEGLLWGMGFKRKEEKKKKCLYCKRSIPLDSNYCPYCGERIGKGKRS